MTKSRTVNGALNGICPYFTMFPLEFPYGILKRHAATDNLVFDPFCGRGTTNYACRLLELPSVGFDSSPVAAAISEAKISNTSPSDIYRVAVEILDTVDHPKDIPLGEFWERAYHPNILRTLCRLRESLLQNCATPERKALRAILLGALHGPVGKQYYSYFSNQCPRTFAPKPNYAAKFWKEQGLEPPRVDMLRIIEERAKRYYVGQKQARGRIVRGDSRDAALLRRKIGLSKARWIITSPPYYGMRTYIPDQWLRNWFVGGPAKVDYSVDGQIAHTAPDIFADQLKSVWCNAAQVSADDARMVIRFGGINDRKAEPLSILKRSLCASGWRIVSIRSAGSAMLGRRQAMHFGQECKQPVNEYDIWARRD